MDIAGISTAMTTANLQSDVSVAMLSKQLETTKTIGEGQVKMISEAPITGVGGNFDERI